MRFYKCKLLYFILALSSLKFFLLFHVFTQIVFFSNILTLNDLFVTNDIKLLNSFL